ncbi:MAG: ACP S-malonyltransferase [Alphaproteobacteria bacterium]
MRFFMFPGQGSQYIGMGKLLAEYHSAAREVFQEVDDALSFSLSRLMFDGSESDLNLTINTQPALMAVSVAASHVLFRETGKKLSELASYVAGHSLGEYSALCVAGSLKLADAARLLRLRGEAMQQAVPKGKGGMLALLGVTHEQASTIATQAQAGQICTIANDNGGGQLVLSGHMEAIERAMEIAPNHGVRRSVLLPVSAPFHCPLMQPAADKMAEALANITLLSPQVPLVANVTASAVSDAITIKKLLVEQVTGTVRWRESVEWLAGQELLQAVELGAGNVLCGLVKRINRDIASTAIGEPSHIEAFLEILAHKAAS